MSEIIVDELKGKTSTGDITVTSEGGAATQSLQQGLAKQFTRYKHTDTAAIQDSLNTSSATDIEVGAFSLSLTNSFSSADVISLATTREINLNDSVVVIGYDDVNSTASTLFFNVSLDDASTGFDSEYNGVATFGGLA